MTKQEIEAEEKRIAEYEAQGIIRSDAQGIVMAENLRSVRKVLCPKCGDEIWDVARGYKMNKCWVCKTVF